MEAAHGAPAPRRSRRTWMAVALAAATGLLAVSVFVGMRLQTSAPSPLAVEALNDHLRVLYSERPVEIESGGIHQVKPWFSGRLDFAPVVAFDGDDEYVLKGGSVGYFVDRKAAVFIYKIRLHTISVLVFPSQGLAWPDANVAVGSHRATATTMRGFHVLLLRNGDIGYAAVSDVVTSDMVKLLAKVTGG